jgi:CelD/BcsL family acetyltransferase involved in cellulose biosynthesis
MFALKSNDTIIATVFGRVVGRHFHGAIIGLDENWARYEPGRLLLAKLFEWCFIEGLQYFDFGIGDEPYKNEYCNVTIPLYEATIPTSLKGQIILLRRAQSLRWRLQYKKWILDNQRRLRSSNEMDLADRCTSDGVEALSVLGHGFRALALWPSPKRVCKFLSVTKRLVRTSPAAD